MVSLPRVLIAAPASGHGKTMVTISLMAALGARGLQVAPNKVGPDYIDPGYHFLATGRPSRNLDAVMVPESLIAPLLAHGAQVPTVADIAIIEGVMGLFDGKLGSQGRGSAAHIAHLTSTPILICADASHTSRTIAATIAGLHRFDPRTPIAGVMFNKVSSPRQQAEIADAMRGVDVPILGFIPRDPGAHAPSRHLGLIPAEERPEAREQLAHFSESLETWVDIDQILQIARSAPDLDVEPWDPAQVVHPPMAVDAQPVKVSNGPQMPAPSPARPIVAMAGGRAFTFRYAETAELLRAGGCEVVEFDPTGDPSLPEGTCGIYIGGGFPEIHAREIAQNQPLLAAVCEGVRAGVPTIGECAGLLYLTEALDDEPMAGVIETTAAMGPRLTMGYRHATAPVDTLLARAGETVIGHEFHRTNLAHLPGQPAWMSSPRPCDEPYPEGVSADPAGTGHPTLHASYLHLHWAGAPRSAQRFIDAVHHYAREARHGL